MRAPALWATFMAIVWVPAHAACSEQFVAFSLGQARAAIERVEAGKDYRELEPEVFQLAHITRVRGLVCDRKTGDTILVGQRDPKGAEITLDDLVVALRARFVRGEWPEVSIDPRADGMNAKTQDVRFKGAIEDTAFGLSLFEADYLLKRIGMNLVPAGIEGFRTEFDFMRLERGTRDTLNVMSRFWFYPTSLETVVREDVVMVKGLRVAVFTQMLSAVVNGKAVNDLNSFHYRPADEFALQVSERYDDLAAVHPPFARVHGLQQLVALAHAIEFLNPKPDLAYWLLQYPLRRHSTPKEVEMLHKSFDEGRLGPQGILEGRLYICGGVGMRAIAIRARAGDVSALREAVLLTRPAVDTLNWRFAVEDWGIGVPTGGAGAEETAQLLSHAEFLVSSKRYEEAIETYAEVLSVSPDCAEAYVGRGLACLANGETENAIADFDRLIDMRSLVAAAHLGRGGAFVQKKDYNRAIVEFTTAMEMCPNEVSPYLARAAALLDGKEAGDSALDKAGKDLDRAVEIDPRCADAYYLRGSLRDEQNQCDLAVADYSRALELSESAKYYLGRAVAYEKKGALALARRDLEYATMFSCDEEISKLARLRLEALQMLDADYVPERPRLRPPMR